MFKIAYFILKTLVVVIIAIPVFIITAVTHSSCGKTANERKYGKQIK